jgi:shikimate dehydrogenase
MQAATIDRYGLVGYPIHHSRSPLIHQLFARQTGEHLSYELLEADPASFETAVRGFSAAGGKGLNVTVPHKQAAFALADSLGAPARQAGAVNTLTFAAGGRMRGDNTDGIGFMRDLTVNHEQAVSGLRVLILGAGGAARGILGPLLETGPSRLVVANRTIERAEELIGRFTEMGDLAACRFADLGEMPAFDLLINATSAGLKGENPPFPPSCIGPDSFCYDLVYGTGNTPFVAWARKHGAARAVQGWGMLVEQAAESFWIWRGKRPDTAPIIKQMPH